MLEFVGKAFRIWFEIILWIWLIGFIIAGGIIGSSMGRYSNGAEGYIFAGIILDGFIGLIFIILSGGLVANFLSMVDNIEKMVQKEKSISAQEIKNKKQTDEKDDDEIIHFG